MGSVCALYARALGEVKFLQLIFEKMCCNGFLELVDGIQNRKWN